MLSVLPVCATVQAEDNDVAVFAAVRQVINSLPEYKGFRVELITIGENKGAMAVYAPDGVLAFSLKPEATAAGRVYHAMAPDGGTLATFQLNAAGDRVKIFDATGGLVKTLALAPGAPPRDITPTASAAFPASDFVSQSADTAFWSIFAAIAGALYKGLSDPQTGYAAYETSGYVFPDQIPLQDLDTAIKSLAVVGPPTEIDDQTIENRSIYFTSNSAGDADSGVAINSGDLTSSYSTVPVIRANNPVSVSFFYNTNSAAPRAYISNNVKLKNREIPENNYIAICGAVQNAIKEFNEKGFHEDSCKQVASFALYACANPTERGGIDVPSSDRKGTVHIYAPTIRRKKICEDFPADLSLSLKTPDYYSWKLSIPERSSFATQSVYINYAPNPEVETAHIAYIWDGVINRGLPTQTIVPTGNYTYSINFKEIYQIQGPNGTGTILQIPFNIPDKPDSPWPPQLVIRNEMHSPFGAGWTLGGLQRIHDTDPNDGAITLTDGDGSIKLFKKSSIYSSIYLGPEGNYSFIQRNSDNTGFRRELTDRTQLFYTDDPLAPGQARITSILDNNGNRSMYAYDESNGRIKCVFLPTHPCTHDASCAPAACSRPNGSTLNDQFYFVYNLDPSNTGTVVVTDPAGRDTTLEIAPACNNGDNTLPTVCRIVNPDGSSVRYTYDAKARLVEKDDPRSDVIDVTTYKYDFTPPGGATCNAIGNVEGIVFPDQRLPEFPSNRQFVRGTTGKDKLPYQDLANYWLDCAHKGGSSEPFAPLARAEDMVNVVYENRLAGSDKDSSFRVYKTNALGSATGFTNALGETTLVSRDENNNPVRTIDPDLNITNMTYDDRGNMLTVHAPARGVAAFIYEPIYNNLVSSTDPRGYSTTYEYDGRGNLVRATAPDGVQAESTYYYGDEYPVKGMLKTSAAGTNTAAPLVTTFTYTPDTVNTAGSDPPGSLASSSVDYNFTDNGKSYNLVGLARSSTVYDNRKTETTYDIMNNRPLSVLGPDNNLVCYGYDEAGNQTWVLDPRFTIGGCPPANTSGAYISKATVMEFDTNNRVTRMTKPMDLSNYYRETRNIEYNPLGQIARADYYNSNPDNPGDTTKKWVTYDYDPAGRLVRAESDDGDLMQQIYNVNGWITRARNNSAELAFEYNNAGDVTSVETFSVFASSEEGPLAQPYTKFSFTYDVAGNRTGLFENFGDADLDIENVNYTYDAAGRVASITGEGRLVTLFDYDGYGRRAQMRRAFGHTTRYEYTSEGQLWKIGAYNAARDEINHFEYEYDPAGRRVKMITRDYDVEYAFSNLDWLTSAMYYNFGKPGSVLSSAEQPNEAFTYDDNGNRLSDNRHGANLDYDPTLNRLEDDGTYTYEYDHNGNVVKKTEVANNGNYWKYFHNFNNKFVRAEKYESSTLTLEVIYHYDPLGRRSVVGYITHPLTGGGTEKYEKYIYDGDDVRLDFKNDASTVWKNALTVRYTHGPGIDEPLIMWVDPVAGDSDSSLKPYFYHADALGSITALTDEDGQIVGKYAYDSFGNLVQECGLLAGRNRYRYTSREWDDLLKLYYYRDRLYDSMAGRFYEADRLFNLNLFFYNRNNSISLLDPFGMEPISGVFTGFALDILFKSILGFSISDLFVSDEAPIESSMITVGPQSEAEEIAKIKEDFKSFVQYTATYTTDSCGYPISSSPAVEIILFAGSLGNCGKVCADWQTDVYDWALKESEDWKFVGKPEERMLMLEWYVYVPTSNGGLVLDPFMIGDTAIEVPW